MRALLIIIIVGAFAWTGYWVLGARGVESGMSAWLEDRRSDGWQAEAAEVTTGGFPYRFDTIFTDLALADPETGLAWSMPTFQLLALSYQPNHLIAIWPATQNLATPLGKIDIATSEMQASAVLEPNTALELRRANVVIRDLFLSSTKGWTAALDSALLASERLEAEPLTHHLGLSIDNLRPGAAAQASLDPAGILPAEIDQMTIDATVSFDRPWDRNALEDRRPQPTRIVLTLAEARWGELDLKIAGDVVVDGDGTPDGDVSIKAVNWRDILEIGFSSGVIPEEFRGILTSSLEALAGVSGNPKTIDATLTLSGGRIFLGPVPIGPAPRLRIR